MGRDARSSPRKLFEQMPGLLRRGTTPAVPRTGRDRKLRGGAHREWWTRGSSAARSCRHRTGKRAARRHIRFNTQMVPSSAFTRVASWRWWCRSRASQAGFSSRPCTCWPVRTTRQLVRHHRPRSCKNRWRRQTADRCQLPSGVILIHGSRAVRVNGLLRRKVRSRAEAINQTKQHFECRSEDDRWLSGGSSTVT